MKAKPKPAAFLFCTPRGTFSMLKQPDGAKVSCVRALKHFFDTTIAPEAPEVAQKPSDTFGMLSMRCMRKASKTTLALDYSISKQASSFQAKVVHGLYAGICAAFKPAELDELDKLPAAIQPTDAQMQALSAQWEDDAYFKALKDKPF